MATHRKLSLDPHERLAAFLKSQKWTKARAAREFGCSPPFVSMIVSGEKLPGRLVANRIEAVSRASKRGVIASEEWDAVELARKAAREDAA